VRFGVCGKPEIVSVVDMFSDLPAGGIAACAAARNSLAAIKNQVQLLHQWRRQRTHADNNAPTTMRRDFGRAT
jgi:hypothetical protein